MTVDGQKQVSKALRSLPWYLFLLPTAYILLSFFMVGGKAIDEGVVNFGDTVVLIKVGFLAWIVRQVVRYWMFKVTRKVRRTLASTSTAIARWE
jgi:hypothetical protein